MKINRNTVVKFNKTPIAEIPRLSDVLTRRSDWMPEPGMMGTEYVGSDRYAVVCVEVFSPKRISLYVLHNINEDNVEKHPDITVDDNGVMWYEPIEKIYKKDTQNYSLRKDKSWRKMGGFSSPVYFGTANPYRDPSF